MRRPAVLLLLAALLGTRPGAAAEQAIPAPDVRVYVADRLLTFDTEPLLVGGRLLVPLRAVFTALGARVEWDPAVRTATAVRNGVTVALPAGSRQARVNGRPVDLEVGARLHRDRLLVPLRFVATALGARVEWDEAARTVRVGAPASPGPAPDALWHQVLAPGRPYDLAGTVRLEARLGGSTVLVQRQAVSLQVRAEGFHLLEQVTTGEGPKVQPPLVRGLAGRGARLFALSGQEWRALPAGVAFPGLDLLGLDRVPVPGLGPAGSDRIGAPALASPGAPGDGAAAAPGAAGTELVLPVAAADLVRAWTTRLPAGTVAGPASVRQAELRLHPGPDGTVASWRVAVAFALPLTGGSTLAVALDGRFQAAPAGGPLPALSGH